MVHTFVFYCQTLNMDLNNYENKLFAPEAQLLGCKIVIYVISSITPYKIN